MKKLISSKKWVKIVGKWSQFGVIENIEGGDGKSDLGSSG